MGIQAAKGIYHNNGETGHNRHTQKSPETHVRSDGLPSTAIGVGRMWAGGKFMVTEP